MPKQSKIIKEVFNEAEQLSKYDIGETIEGLARKIGKPASEILKLNSNENFFVPLSFLRDVLKEAMEAVDPRIYPRDEPSRLKEALAKDMAVLPEEIVIGTGSDQLIDLMSRMFLRRGDEALSIAPTFSIYKRCVKIQGGIYRSVPLKEDFSLDTDRILASVTPRTKMLILCSPNNPTANQFSLQEIEFLAKSFEGLVAVDEAYVNFADFSLVNLAKRLDNLVVFRTFSKVFGLAGLRLGYIVTNLDLARVMDEKYQMPYNVDLISLKTATMLLERIEVIKQAIKETKTERSRLMKALNQMPSVHAFDSKTNFILFQANRDSNKLYESLLKKGVIIRNIGQVLRYENCLRVTVAPAPMTERFLAILAQVLGE